MFGVVGCGEVLLLGGWRENGRVYLDNSWCFVWDGFLFGMIVRLVFDLGGIEDWLCEGSVGCVV